MTRALLALALATLPTLATAQTPPAAVVIATSKLAFDHDGVGVDKYEMRLDSGGAWFVITPARQGTTISLDTPFPPTAPGAHSLVVRACNAAGCAESLPFTFVAIAVPAKPANLRIQ